MIVDGVMNSKPMLDVSVGTIGDRGKMGIDTIKTNKKDVYVSLYYTQLEKMRMGNANYGGGTKYSCTCTVYLNDGNFCPCWHTKLRNRTRGKRPTNLKR